MKRREIVGKIASVASAGLLLNAAKAKASAPPGIDGLSYVFDVHKYGAFGDGRKNDAAAIQKAINACAKNGGGIVVLHNGIFLSGGITLKSNVELHLTASATLLGINDVSLYNTDTKSAFKSPSRSFIYAADCHHISITGSGKIDGQGQLFTASDAYAIRPRLVQIRDCKDVKIQDIMLSNSAVWACWLLQCEKVRIEGIRIDNPISPNRDGIDIDGCREVVISNCNIKTEDDSIAFKVSSKGHPCRDIVVTNCILSSKCAAIRFGPDAIDNIENITVSNCVIRDTKLNGIKIQQSMGAAMRNITFSNIVMENTSGPISLRVAGWKLPDGTDAPFEINDSNWENGKLEHILFDNIRATTPINNICISITGTTKTRPRHITFSNIDFSFMGGGTAKQASRRDVPDLDRDYPEVYIFGDLPAYAVYMHHVSDVILQNTQLHLEGDDLRPAIVCDDVDGLELAGLKAAGSVNAESVIRLQQTSEVFIYGSRTLNQTGTFLRVEGANSKNIQLQTNTFLKCSKILDTGVGVPAEAVNVN